MIGALNGLLAAGIDASLKGGRDADALLGRQTRDHADLGLAIARVESILGCSAARARSAARR